MSVDYGVTSMVAPLTRVAVRPPSPRGDYLTAHWAPPLDLYNPVACAREAAARVPGARFAEIPSEYGHNAATSADPSAAAFLDAEIARFLA